MAVSLRFISGSTLAGTVVRRKQPRIRGRLRTAHDELGLAVADRLRELARGCWTNR